MRNIKEIINKVFKREIEYINYNELNKEIEYLNSLK